MPPSNSAKHRLIVEGRDCDLCSVDPGFEIDLLVETDLRTMTAIWMGVISVQAALTGGKMTLDGDNTLKSSMQQWLGLSPFATEKKKVA